MYETRKYKILSFLYWFLWRIIYIPKEMSKEMSGDEKEQLLKKRYPEAWIEICHKCNPDENDECGSFKGGGTNAKGFRHRRKWTRSNLIWKFLFKIRFFVNDEYFDYKLRPTGCEQTSHYFDSMSHNWHLEEFGISICQGCYEGIQEYGNSIAIHTKDETISIIADGHYVINDWNEESDEFRDEIKAIQDGEKVHRLSAWRISRRFEPDESILVNIDSDAFLDGHGSNHMQKAKNDLFREACSELDIVLFFVSSPTGNVCSRALDYFVRTKDISEVSNVKEFVDSIVDAGNYKWSINIIFQSAHAKRLIKELSDLMVEQVGKINKLKNFDKTEFWKLVAKDPKQVIEKIKEIMPLI